MLINQFLYTKMAYNPQKDLLMLSQMASAPVTLVVHPSVPANNMKELLAWVKAQQGQGLVWLLGRGLVRPPGRART